MKYMFVILEEWDDETRDKVHSCLFLSGDRADEFIGDPAKFMEGYSEDTKLIGNWVVPEDHKSSVTGEDSIHEAFDAFLALDNFISELPLVSDIYATIFHFGYMLAKKEK